MNSLFSRLRKTWSAPCLLLLSVAAFWLPANPAGAAVAFGSRGNVATGTTSLSVPYPASIAAEDLLVLVVGNKYPTNGPATPTGWTKVGQGSGGLGAAGADSGQVYSTIFVKEAAGTESGNLAVTVTSANTSMARMFRYTKASGTAWTYDVTTGTDNVANTTWSITGAGNPGIAAGDMIIVASALNGNRVTTWTESITATGATFGATTERQDSSSGTGNDMGLIVSEHPVTAGTAAAAPVYTMTGASGTANANSPTGASVILRIREATLNCFTDDFNRASLGSDWSATNSSGSFGSAQIVGNRLRLTDASGNVATAAHLQRMFPGAGNKIIVEFDHFAYGGTGADGIAVTLSDASVTPQAGAYGGSLGYAQRTGVNGFAGGWLGVGIDEYGNFANPTEGRNGGPGFTVDSVAVRGSGSGTTGYAYHATSGTVSPGIDQTVAAVTHVGAGASLADADGGSVTPPLPGHQANDLLLCAATSNDNTAHSVATAGWTAVYQIAQSGSNPRSSLFYKRATSSTETNPTITHSGGGGIVAGCSAFRGVDTTTPFDVAYAAGHYADTVNSGNVTSGSMTTVTANAMMLFVGHINNNRCNLSTSVTGGLTWAESFCWDSGQGNDETIAMHYAAKAATGAIGPITFTQSNTDENRGVLLVLRPAAVGSSGHRYRITLNHSNGTNANVKLERNTGSGYTTLVTEYDAKAQAGQAAVPVNWMLSYTGSTGGSTNIHEIDSLSVCTLQPIAVTGLNHVRLNHTGSAVTCLGEQVTVHACNDADSSGTCTANTTGLTGNVVAKSSGGATLATVPFTIASGSSSTTVTVPVTTAQTVTFETSGLSVTPTASPAWTCWNGSAASCSNIYSDAGFIVSSTAGGGEATIPARTAGTASGTYYLRAVKTSTTTQACEAALTGASTVSFAYECINPSTCHTSDLMTVNGGSGSTTISRNNSGSVTSYASVSLTFDANGNAPFTFNYADVGQTRLYATKAASGALLTALSGSTNAFVTAPYDFAVAASGPYVAGSAFSATVTARTASGATTPNFGKEATAAGVAMTHTLTGPVGGAAGSLSGSVGSFGGTTAGVGTGSNLIFTEVGDISLIATNTNYLGSGLNATGSGAAGPFKPAYFDTAVTPGTNTFTYSGQPFTVTVTAKNALGATTVNYAGSYARDVTLSDANAGTNNSGTLGTFANANIPAASFTIAAAGVASVSTIAYTFTSRATAPLTLAMRAVDTDSVSSSGHTEGTNEIRSGRVRMANAYGSERLVLPVMAQAEYYTAAGWILNTADTGASATPLAAAPTVVVTGGITTAANCPPPTACTTSSRFSGGLLDLRMTAPNAAGYADITLNVPTWLEYPWRSATAEDPVSRATFGIYKGNNKIIYRRERY